ncbi:putative calcium-binding protein CML25 [Acorus calamus]|uniref:Calcium-binding protein CML25 n=1 Tax=Acorus calamus TaxID=4465 RepID=A0AAV9CPU2_ACOCL|nr:putative calcium-binding protein CML25 [Acorus calamus]
MMVEADSDDNGFIDLGEFMELTTRDRSISAEELGEEMLLARCQRMITEFDRNSNGRICFNEFKVMMMGSSID